ncbi:MAG TPA: hypothetical protein DEG47_20820 [Cyanobacteria bacterium UBA11148]|nr:hypothetical protein [Cyanobacteria bacterium UBA11148]
MFSLLALGLGAASMKFGSKRSQKALHSNRR